MEGRVNYLAVGIFVATFIAGIMVFAFWLMKYGTYKKMDSYIVYFDESVAGLNKDASVKYMGVDVGTVNDIRVNPSATRPVAVYLRIDHAVRIKEDAEATLKFYGMTGLAYIEISSHNPAAPPLKAQNGKIPVIRSAPSFYAQLDQALAEIAEEFTKTTDKVEQLLSDQNLHHIEATLANIDSLTGELDTHKADITMLLQKGKELEQKATQTLAKINTIAGEFDPKLGTEVQRTLREIKKLVHHVDKTLSRGDYNIRELSTPTLQKLNLLIEKLSLLSDETEQTLQQLQQSPSDLLFKRNIIKPGPGEK